MTIALTPSLADQGVVIDRRAAGGLLRTLLVTSHAGNGMLSRIVRTFRIMEQGINRSQG